MKPCDLGLDTLLEMDGSIIDQENGYWCEIHAWKVIPSADIPHGVRYSLTLHNSFGKRILGYDNAHRIKPPKKLKFAGRRLPYDHKHRHATDKGIPYEFRSAYDLLTDFFLEVDRVLTQDKDRKK